MRKTDTWEIKTVWGTGYKFEEVNAYDN